MSTLKLIKDEIAKYFLLKDEGVVDIIFATILGNALIAKGRIWMVLVGSSGSGKTSLVDPFRDEEEVEEKGKSVKPSKMATYFLDDLSKDSFLSGFQQGAFSLLHRITKLKKATTMIFSDFTTVLSKDQESRGQILGQFRVIYDGNMGKDTGVGNFTWSAKRDGKLGTLCCATQNVYRHLEACRAMGERFLYYCIVSPDRKDMLKLQRKTTLYPEEITDLLRPMYYEYSFDIRGFIKKEIEKNGEFPQLKLTDEQHERIETAACFCADSKATVPTDFKSGRVAGMPEIALPSRDNRGYRTLLHMLWLMDCFAVGDFTIPVSEERIKLIEKCAYSAIGTERRKILEALSFSSQPIRTAHLSNDKYGLNLPPEAIEKFLAPLAAVGIVEKDTVGDSSVKTWRIKDENIRQFIRDVSATLRDESQPKDLSLFDAGGGGNDPSYQTDEWEARKEREHNNY